MNYKEMFFLIGRYSILVLLALDSLVLFYTILTPLTLYLSYLFISAFYPQAALDSTKNIIIIGTTSIELIKACIAGAAYYLILILNLTTPMRFKTRIKSISFLMISFLLINVIRIVIFSFLFARGAGYYFDVAHILVWYLGSTIFVVAIWFVNVRIFNLQSVPFYTDVKTITSDMFPGKSLS